jgi:hypothetical protein
MGRTIILTKTHPDELHDISKAETFQISLLGGPAGEQIIQEQHGWWDEENQKAQELVTTLRPEKRESLEEASEIYLEQIALRVREGFVHSHSYNFDEGKFVYRNLSLSQAKTSTS